MRLILAAFIVATFSIEIFAEDVVSSPITFEFEMPFQSCFVKDKYISGEDCYQNHNKPQFASGEWNFLEVPISYKSNSGKTKISYHLSKNFSLGKKTIVYFNGGPGGTSFQTDFTMIEEDVNVIYFNQRGAAFSRPESEELFNNQDYYSSENTARDALEIVKHLGVDKITAYGMSYGTVPATIFGSLFPEYTRNVILEGVVYDGQNRLWYGSHRIKLVQRYFDSLDAEMKANILKYSNYPEVFTGWFSAMAQRLMYGANFQTNMTNRLNSIFNNNITDVVTKENIIVQMLKQYSYSAAGDYDNMIFYSPTMFNYISCKELSAQDELASFYAVFNEKNKLVPFKKTSVNANHCDVLKINDVKTYSAVNYPIHVPVIYIQGTTDGATTAEYAVWHYKNSAKGKAQLILAKNEGHAVAIQHLSEIMLTEQEKNDPAVMAALEGKKAIQQEIVNIFKAAINNEDLSLIKLNNLIGNKKSSWVKTQK